MTVADDVHYNALSFSYMHSYFSDEIYYNKSLNSPIFVIGPKKIGCKITSECPFNGSKYVDWCQEVPIVCLNYFR